MNTQTCQTLSKLNADMHTLADVFEKSANSEDYRIDIDIKIKILPRAGDVLGNTAAEEYHNNLISENKACEILGYSRDVLMALVRCGSLKSPARYEGVACS